MFSFKVLRAIWLVQKHTGQSSTHVGLCEFWVFHDFIYCMCLDSMLLFDVACSDLGWANCVWLRSQTTVVFFWFKPSKYSEVISEHSSLWRHEKRRILNPAEISPNDLLGLPLSTVGTRPEEGRCLIVVLRPAGQASHSLEATVSCFWGCRILSTRWIPDCVA